VKPLEPEMVRKKVAVFADLVRQRKQLEQAAALRRETQQREYDLQISELRVASDRRYRKLVDGIDHAIAWSTDESLRLTFVSRQAWRILGYPPDYFLEADFWARHLHADDRESVLSVFRRALADGADHMINHRLIASDGRSVWFHTGVSGDRGAG